MSRLGRISVKKMGPSLTPKYSSFASDSGPALCANSKCRACVRKGAVLPAGYTMVGPFAFFRLSFLLSLDPVAWVDSP